MVIWTWMLNVLKLNFVSYYNNRERVFLQLPINQTILNVVTVNLQ